MEDTKNHTDIGFESSPEETEGTRYLGVADERLSIIEERVAARSSGDSKEVIENNIDLSLRDLVKDTAEAWRKGSIDTAKAGEMLLIALEKIDEYKDDSDPSTNGELIAGALAGLPSELLEGPLKDFIEAEGHGELMDLIAEIQRNSPKEMV